MSKEEKKALVYKIIRKNQEICCKKILSAIKVELPDMDYDELADILLELSQ